MREIFNALGHPLRLKIYTALLEDELSVSELTDLFDISNSDLSQHLDRLDEVDLIECDERGPSTYYQAKSNPFEEACELVLEQENNSWHQLRKDIISVRNNGLSSSQSPPASNSTPMYSRA